MFGSLYYNVTTDVIVCIMAVILCGIMKYMHPRKTPYYVYLSTGMFMVMLSGIIDVILSFSVQDIDMAKHAGSGMFILFVMLAGVFLHLSCITNAVQYIIFLAPDARRHTRSIEVAGRCIGIMLTVCYAFAYVYAGEQHNSSGIVTLSMYLVFIAYVCLAVAVFVIVFMLFHRHEIPNVIICGILLFAPFYVMLAVIQMLILRSVIITAICFMPILVLYMFFHSNPFDEVIGCQNTYSMEVRFSQNVKDRTEFYFGYISMPSLLHSVSATDDLSDTNVIVEIVRMMENRYRGMHVFRKTAGEFYIIYEVPHSEEHMHDLEDIGAILLDRVKAVSTTEKCIMICLQYSSRVTDLNMMTDIVKQALAKYSNRYGACIKVIDAEGYSDLIEAYYLASLLEQLRDTGNFMNNNILCFAQPIYDIRTESFRTAEALMRLEVNGRIISPDVFIPIAESHDCIHFLTLCMLHRVCAAIVDFNGGYDFDAISINVSVQEFSEAEVADEFLGIITHYNIPADRIRIELTESALSTDNSMLAHNMQMLSDAGIKFYLDDFGTGYSSLDRITELPFSIIKFDKSLLYSAISNDKTDRLVRGLIPLLKSDGFMELVEGVEDDSQHAMSIDLGFDYVQGYRWAKPVPVCLLKNYFRCVGAPEKGKG